MAQVTYAGLFNLLELSAMLDHEKHCRNYLKTDGHYHLPNGEIVNEITLLDNDGKKYTLKEIKELLE